DQFKNYLCACSLAFVVAAGIFIILPASMNRPDPSLITNELLRQHITRLYGVDSGQCTFPSLHIAMTIMAMRVFGRRRPLALMLGIFIGISTMIVKQHVLLDVVGGALLAFAVCVVQARLPRVRAAVLPPSGELAPARARSPRQSEIADE
ncbi:MAG TPA: phosphatase PAP2 family protein, partial [bacterium]|nr:phosphatase PAP2 family protein [bacterium]